MLQKERRKDIDHLLGDQRTKQIIICTLCGCAFMFAATVCWLALQSMEVPDPLDRLATFIVGNLAGVLAKTGVDAARKDTELPKEIGEAVVEASQKEPVETKVTKSAGKTPVEKEHPSE